MNPADNLLFGAAASRKIDVDAQAHLGITGFALMERAAAAIFSSVLRRFPGVRGLTLFCGKGNNAGDAYLVAQLARTFGLHTQVLALVPPEELDGDALRAYQFARQAGVLVEAAGDQPFTGDVIVDGLLGTGLRGAPRAPFAEIIGRINNARLPVVSVDTPSGVDADTGTVVDIAVKADVTVSLITRKIGLYTGQGIDYAGEREWVDLGVPYQAYGTAGVPRLFYEALRLPLLQANTYKHRQGHVVVIGGDLTMPGAVAMAAHACLRVGAGLVTALTRPEHVTALVTRTPEVMVQGFSVAMQAPALELIKRANMLVLGPGLGRGNWGQALYACAQASDKPTLLDADGLYRLAQSGRWQGGPLVITPHIAEAARLLDTTVEHIQSDRLGAAQALAERFACAGVLKGAGSVVFDSSGAHLSICAHGNPGMATAGMGDVLSGVVGGLAAQALNQMPAQIYSALRFGVALHSATADKAARLVGMRSLMATDVISELPQLLLEYEGAENTTQFT